jgi:hypothetical protein
MIRSRAQRIVDTLATLDHERSCWMAVGLPDGTSHLIPLSYCWDGERVVIATRLGSTTVRALQRTGRARLSLPSTDDVVIIDATAVVVTLDAIDAATHNFFRMVAGFDPGSEPEPYVYAVLTPQRILAWRDERELDQREIMHGGVWTSDYS